MKPLLFAITFFAAILCQAQPYFSIMATTKGAGFSIGYLEKQSGIDLSAGYNIHPTSEEVPTLMMLTVGKQILLSHNEKDNYGLTPSAGFAAYSVKDFTSFYKDEADGVITEIKTTKAFVGLELGKDSHLGRVYVNVNYCNAPFFGIGLRAFFR